MLGGEGLNKRRLKLIDYDIDNDRYDELLGFCHQYPKWLDELKYKTNTLKSNTISDMPFSGNKNKVTENLAIRRTALIDKCKFIEQAAIAADSDYYEYIIKHVAFKKSVHYLINVMGMPMSASAFYDKRKLFFVELDKIKN